MPARVRFTATERSSLEQRLLVRALVLAVPLPEIALFKWVRSRGRAERQSYVYDASGHLLGQGRDALGEVKYDRFTILIFISFAVADIDKSPIGPLTAERALRTRLCLGRQSFLTLTAANLPTD